MSIKRMIKLFILLFFVSAAVFLVSGTVAAATLPKDKLFHVADFWKNCSAGGMLLGGFGFIVSVIIKHMSS